MFVPDNDPVADGVPDGDFLLHATPTIATTAARATIDFVLYLMHPPPPALSEPNPTFSMVVRVPAQPSCRSSLHRSGQRPGPQVALEEIDDQHDRQGQDGGHGGHLLGRYSVDGLKHLERKRQLI